MSSIYDTFGNPKMRGSDRWSVEAINKVAANFRRRVRGYKPCKLVTNRENKRGQVLLQFEDDSRMWMDATKVDRT